MNISSFTLQFFSLVDFRENNNHDAAMQGFLVGSGAVVH